MIEIIPNWHPIFVHFTVGLFSTAVGFYLLAYLTSHFTTLLSTWSHEFEVVGRWCLWVVSLVTIITVLAGLQAYYTVGHDEISHRAMTNHRNWALSTAGMIMLLGIWSVWRHIYHKTLTITFIIALLVGQALLLSTAWRGAELVFRYGLGVMSLPAVEEVGHNHSSSTSTANTTNNAQEQMPQSSLEVSAHEHNHSH